MIAKDKLEALVGAAQEYGGVVHGDWYASDGTQWLDVEFPNTTAAILCLTNFGDLTEGAYPRDPVWSFTASVVVVIPLEVSNA